MYSPIQLFPLLTLASLTVGENNVEADDVPQACRTNPVCQQVFNISSTCDSQTENNNDYVNCVCGTSNAQSILNSCAACVYDNERDDDRTDNDVTDLMRDCSWSFTPSATSGTTTGSVTLSVATITSSSTTFVSTQTPSTSTSTGITTSTSAVSQNHAAAPTAMAAGVLMGAAAVALVLG
ncbi:hypothetical protein SUNI508_10812 [Seiridium unicorne]|uniref:Gpi anchored protein n=1 Tax=Seiridium unicorne TaxID=138068 RepID=A0ABR2UKH0_9PEZI